MNSCGVHLVHVAIHWNIEIQFHAASMTYGTHPVRAVKGNTCTIWWCHTSCEWKIQEGSPFTTTDSCQMSPNIGITIYWGGAWLFHIPKFTRTPKVNAQSYWEMAPLEKGRLVGKCSVWQFRCQSQAGSFCSGKLVVSAEAIVGFWVWAMWIFKLLIGINVWQRRRHQQKMDNFGFKLSLKRCINDVKDRWQTPTSPFLEFSASGHFLLLTPRCPLNNKHKPLVY